MLIGKVRIQGSFEFRLQNNSINDNCMRNWSVPTHCWEQPCKSSQSEGKYFLPLCYAQARTAFSQAARPQSITHTYKGTREDTHACVHAVFPLGCTPAVRLTKVDPGLNFNIEYGIPFLSNPYILPHNLNAGWDSLVLVEIPLFFQSVTSQHLHPTHVSLYIKL